MTRETTPGLVLSVWKPSITSNAPGVTYVPRGHLIGDFIGYGGLGFTMQADGGFWSLDATLAGDRLDAEEWLEYGLGRHVELVDHGLGAKWEGFVNSIQAVEGGLSTTRGPLMEIINRCSATYAMQQIIGNEIVTTQGLQTTIGPANPPVGTVHIAARNSQLKYGIFEKIVSGGTVWSSTEAADIRDSWLNDRMEPETSKSFSVPGSTPPSVSISCLGYIHFLKNYIYDAVDAGDNVSVPIYNPTLSANSKLKEVLNADPNGLLIDSAATWDFDNVSILEPRWDDQLSDAYTMVRSMVTKGSGSDTRMLFGVYAGRKIVFKEIPTDIKYKQMLADPRQDVEEHPGNSLYPWEVGVGEWTIFTDFMIGRAAPQTPTHLDPRAMFIERVAYGTPMGLQLDGSKVGTLKQKLARLGLGVA